MLSACLSRTPWPWLSKKTNCHCAYLFPTPVLKLAGLPSWKLPFWTPQSFSI